MSKHEDYGKYLFNTYPNLFKEEQYVACGEGWFNIIGDLSKQINDYVEKLPLRTEDPYVTVVQIKEKFGGLRYYVNYSQLDDEQVQQIEDMIRAAETKTTSTCEDCGGDGSMVSPRRYWMRTLCKKCVNNYDMGDTPNGI